MLTETFLTNNRLIPYTQGMKLTADSNLLGQWRNQVFWRPGRLTTMAAPDGSYDLKK